MALAIANVSKEDVGQRQKIVADITFDGSYPTGGEAIAGSDLGFRIGNIENVEGSAAGRVVSFDGTNNLLLVHESAGAAGALREVPNTTDLSGLTVRCEAWGR